MMGETYLTYSYRGCDLPEHLRKVTAEGEGTMLTPDEVGDDKMPLTKSTAISQMWKHAELCSKYSQFN